jgi:hypothetical protein
MTLLAELEEFVGDHRSHGTLTCDATEPTWNGYLLTVACSCGVVFERWITPEDATWICCGLARPSNPIRARVRVAGALRGRTGPGMSRYVSRSRPEPMSEEFVALLILLGPLAFVARWIWRCLLREDQEQQGKHYKTSHDEGQ